MELQRQVAALQSEAARLKAAATGAPPAAAGRKTRAPQRMQPYTPAPASPSPQPTVHSEHASSHAASAAPPVATERSGASVEGSSAGEAQVDLAPHGPEASGGGHTPPWQPLQAVAAATAQSRAVHGAAGGHVHAAGDGSGRPVADVAASLADMHGPGAPEAELSLLEAASLQPAASDPFSHLSLLTPPGPLLADSSESQRSLSGSGRHALSVAPLQARVQGDDATGGGAAMGAGASARLTSFGRRSPSSDTPDPVEGLGSSGSSGPPVPMPSPTLSPIGHGGVSAQGQRRPPAKAAGDVDESTSQWGVTGMGSLENVIDFLGKSDGNLGSTHLSPTGGNDTAQSATPAAAVHT